MTEQLLLSIPGAAKALGIGPDLTWELVHSGELPSVHIGRRRLIRVSDLREYVEQLLPDPGNVSVGGHRLGVVAAAGRRGRASGHSV